jgi:hypothetical protein
MITSDKARRNDALSIKTGYLRKEEEGKGAIITIIARLIGNYGIPVKPGALEITLVVRYARAKSIMRYIAIREGRGKTGGKTGNKCHRGIDGDILPLFN